MVAVYPVSGANWAGFWLQVTVAVYCIGDCVSLIDITGVAPGAGAGIDVIVKSEITREVVAGKTATMTPELAALEVLIAPGTLNELGATPLNPKFDAGVKVMVAVYVVFAANVVGDELQVTVPVNWLSGVITDVGVAPVVGTEMPLIVESVTVSELIAPGTSLTS